MLKTRAMNLLNKMIAGRGGVSSLVDMILFLNEEELENTMGTKFLSYFTTRDIVFYDALAEEVLSIALGLRPTGYIHDKQAADNFLFFLERAIWLQEKALYSID